MTPEQRTAFKNLLYRFSELRLTLSGDYGGNHYGQKMLAIMDDTIRDANDALGLPHTVGKKAPPCKKTTPTKKRSPGEEIL